MPRRSFFVLKSYYRMAVDIKFLLAWCVVLFLRFKKLIILLNGFFIAAP